MKTVKKERQRKVFYLYEIRAAMRRWKNIWMEDRDFQIDWHNFKYDLFEVTKPKRSRN